MQEPNNSQISKQSVELSSKSRLIVDVLVFQLKLAGDGIRDIILSPLSFISVIAGIILTPSQPDYYFKRLMHLGYKSDRWLNLFGFHKKTLFSKETTSDVYVKKVEELLIKDYQEGGVTRVVKEHTDKFVHATKKGPPQATPPDDTKMP